MFHALSQLRPQTAAIPRNMNLVTCFMRATVLALLFLVGPAVPNSSAQGTFTSLFSFPASPAEGAGPRAALIQGQDGLLYGTSSGQGINFYGGTVFNITTSGTLTNLYSFTYCQQQPCPDGSTPYGGLVQDSQGNLYGTTVFGGTANSGTVFRITPSGTLTTLYTFCTVSGCPDGSGPTDGVILGADGNLYGTTRYGGATTAAEGTIFRISTSGKNFKTLHSFTGSDGYVPLGIMQASSGTFYGVTYQGGVYNGTGTIFKMTASGKVTTLFKFCAAQDLQTNCLNGAYPTKAPIQGKDGNFYGVTTQGGAPNAPNGGTVYKMTASGTVTTLYSFCVVSGCPDGAGPSGGIIQATDGNFYGTTTTYGGTIFEITSSGSLTTLYKFCSQPFCDDGSVPWGALLEDTNGILYGTTFSGGTGGIGTVFSMALPQLAAFLTASPSQGKVGASVILLGSNLAGATAVTFNGTPATFTVASGGGSINTSVPAGATTGKIHVTTPTGTLSTVASFKVIPQITSFTPSSGPVGTSVTITGVSLSQTSKVSFGGVKATFTVNSDTQVTATVPTGAKTGKIVITTPGGTATSPTQFTVM